MKVAVMIDKSAGNESVGNMWTEVLLFDRNTSLEKVLNKINQWAVKNNKSITNTIRINIAEEV